MRRKSVLYSKYLYFLLSSDAFLQTINYFLDVLYSLDHHFTPQQIINVKAELLVLLFSLIDTVYQQLQQDFVDFLLHWWNLVSCIYIELVESFSLIFDEVVECSILNHLLV